MDSVTKPDSLQRTKNATIEVIIEEHGFNNSLAGELNCPNAYEKPASKEAKATWINTYLKDGKCRTELCSPKILYLTGYSNHSIQGHD